MITLDGMLECSVRSVEHLSGQTGQGRLPRQAKLPVFDRLQLSGAQGQVCHRSDIDLVT
jgi:hypothetical protein